MNKAEAVELLTRMYQDIVIEMNTDKIPHYFKEEYIQITDGVRSDRAELIRHIATLRELVESLTLSPFQDMLFDQSSQTAALRYTVEIVKKNGSRGQVELIAIYELDGPQIVRCHELSRPLGNQEEFQEIASVRHS
ncbi:metallopeptidase [Paenibacillus sp. CAA11]|uniref:nuclear transport factor 2 family protein n=1 Tax=Paenibacillus sp. CAA11 TaxID=1532905 RepID=UPI000D3C79F5|nr:nuclear transport factor 2 family protein [Paenibacillus sp. CAA11]AWB43011.1 metallopeptidase [Paenibacillus sp. CAA11]